MGYAWKRASVERGLKGYDFRSRKRKRCMKEKVDWTIQYSSRLI